TVAQRVSVGMILLLALGCSNRGGTGGSGATGGTGGKGGSGRVPTFSLAWSEYPSWSVFGVAHEKKLIDGAAGKQGPIEQKWGVDIELRERAYDPCIQEYSASSCDAVCITNMDVLAPSLTRDSVAILPTSTSAGADACIVVGIDVSDKAAAMKELRKH